MPPTEAAMAKLAETMAKYCHEHVCKYHPDYPSYTPPPTSKPSRIKESMVALADTMAKLELASKRLAASTANLVPITSQTTFTTNESNDHTTNTKTDITETTTEVKIETTSLIIDINNHNNTITQVLITTASQNANIKTITEDHPTINMTTENRVTTIPNTETKVTAQTPRSPFNTAHKLSETQTRTLSIHLIVEQTYVHDMLIEDILVIFRCVETFPPVHQCYPPKFVLLESEDDPPWEPNDPRYKTMSLEDKAHFKGGSIDTYLNVHRYRGLMNYLVKVIVLVFHARLHFLMQVYNR
ncbi:hypothetical protein Tco_0990352 [Tanacetum coccineum]|uniref:Uncharacterized protein n=1 Tax=Tanacetum coccineum TaxID=301880 RepID=A0ABQ5EWV4_9ASTR